MPTLTQGISRGVRFIENRIAELEADIQEAKTQIEAYQAKMRTWQELTRVPAMYKAQAKAVKKIPAKKVPKAKKAVKSPIALVPPENAKAVTSTLEYSIRKNKEAYLPVEVMIAAYNRVIDGREDLTYAQMVTAINALPSRSHTKITYTALVSKFKIIQRSSHKEFSEVFTLIPGYKSMKPALVTLNEKAADRFLGLIRQAKAS